MGKFEELYGLNVNDKTEKKGNLTYLSWVYAWAEFKKAYPEATYHVKKFDGFPYIMQDGVGAIVYTEVTAGGLSYEMWLPVMDNRNNTILQPKMTEINKAIMRCLTKNLAMFGLGLYIYAGEDLPEGCEGEDGKADDKKQGENEPKNVPKQAEKVEPFKPLTKAELVKIWGVSNAEATVTWLEGRFGCEFGKLTQEQTEYARELLGKQKKKREDEEKRQRALEKISEEDIPFPLKNSEEGEE